MVFDRKDIPKLNQEDIDNDLLDAIKEGGHKELQIERERNNHEIKKLQTSQGFFGKIIGEWNNMPMFAALFSVLAGFCGFAFLANAEHQKLSLAFASSAISYMFGRSSSN